MEELTPQQARDIDQDRLCELEAHRFVINYSDDPKAVARAKARFDAAEYERLLDLLEDGWT